jgi:hypothetical protein
MNHEFALLIPRNFTSPINSIGFSIKGFCRSLCACAADGPTILVGYNMLISLIAHF